MDHHNCPDNCPQKVEALNDEVRYWVNMTMEARQVAGKLRAYIETVEGLLHPKNPKKRGVIIG